MEATSKTLRSYLDALVARGGFADYFTDDVSWTTVGGGQELHGRGPVRDFLIWMHTQAFNAYPKIKTLVVGDEQAALEADFVGTHTGEFLGIPATGSRCRCPTAWSTTCSRKDRRPSRLHPHGPVRPTAPVSSTWCWSAHP